MTKLQRARVSRIGLAWALFRSLGTNFLECMSPEQRLSWALQYRCNLCMTILVVWTVPMIYRLFLWILPFGLQKFLKNREESFWVIASVGSFTHCLMMTNQALVYSPCDELVTQQVCSFHRFVINQARRIFQLRNLRKAFFVIAYAVNELSTFSIRVQHIYRISYFILLPRFHSWENSCRYRACCIIPATQAVFIISREITNDPPPPRFQTHSQQWNYLVAFQEAVVRCTI